MIGVILSHLLLVIHFYVWGEKVYTSLGDFIMLNYGFLNIKMVFQLICLFCVCSCYLIILFPWWRIGSTLPSLLVFGINMLNICLFGFSKPLKFWSYWNNFCCVGIVSIFPLFFFCLPMEKKKLHSLSTWLLFFKISWFCYSWLRDF